MLELFTNIDIANYVEDAFKWVGVAAVVAAATPTKKDDTIVGYVKGFIHFLAFNFGKAENKK